MIERVPTSFQVEVVPRPRFAVGGLFLLVPSWWLVAPFYDAVAVPK